MLSFFKLFYRNSLRNKSFTLLNILGLATGMASFIIIMLWVKAELSYDSYNLEAGRIFRMNMYSKINGYEGTSDFCPSPLAGTLLKDYPEVEKAVRFRSFGKVIIKYNDISYSEERFVYADSSVFGVFTIPVIKGNPDAALKVPFTVAISQSMAEKYFGSEDPINKILRIDNTSDYRITAVFSDIPKASHFHFDFIASLYSTKEYNEGIWLNNNFHTYFLLRKNSDPTLFQKKLPELVERYIAPQAAAALGTSWDKLLGKGFRIEFSAVNVRDIHLTPGINGEFEPGGDIKYVYIFISIAIFIILLACINFTNLSTARSTTRLKEVGVRKVFGVRRWTLAFQFMLESLIIVFIAYIIAMVLTEISLPFFNELTDKNLSINYFDARFIGGVVGLVLVISVLAGIYPAIYLSSFRPISILKGEMVSGRKKTKFRSMLVISQFTISLILLSSVLILNKQMKFIQNKNLGYNKEQLLVIKNGNLLEKNNESFKDKLLANPQILNISQSGYLPSPSDRIHGSIWRDAIMSNDPVSFTHFFVDFNYIRTFGLKIIKGREFSKDFSTDSAAVVINQAAVKLLGWKDPIGRKIGAILTSDFDVNHLVLDAYTIIGVVEDFNFNSLHSPVEAMGMYVKKSNDMITCRLRPDTNVPQIVSFLKSTWVENAPGQPFDYDFLTDSLHRQYGGDLRLGKILGIFTGLALFVSCLGLFGLALYASEQRKKEIGLRKVNGSGMGQIIWLLTSDFTKLILIASIIACPVSYWMMNNWIQNFAYRTGISWWIFVLTVMMSCLIALATIGYQAYKAASTNPVKTLRSE
jgi:putative ABC transport system permease protein